jgi:peptide/nickel transport system substrate-binding protein
VNAKRNARALALAAATSLIVAACTIEGPASVRPTTRAPTSSFRPSPPPTPTLGAHAGGDVTFGAESWPQCLNPITACADNAWTYYTVLEHVLPRAMQLDPKGNFVPSPLLVEAPSLNTGDLAQSPFTVTFKIRPEAVWDDGSPITSEDFDFTWHAILLTPGAIRTAGYQQIEYIDSTDPSVAVIGFKAPFADWPDLFGGAFGFILKESAFSGQVGLFSSFRFAMLESIPFSGGPFLLRSWTKEKAVLVRNDSYFGSRANFDSVTFIPFGTTGLDDELGALAMRHVLATYLEPAAVRLLDRQAGLLLKAIGARGTDYDALRFDLSRPPLDDPKVREALMYAIDRQAVIDDLIKDVDPDAKVLNCGFVALPRIGPWCQTTPFAHFTYDPKKAKSILQSDGYDCSVSPCTKNGEALRIGYGTLDSSGLRTETRDLLIPKALRAGFELQASTSSLPPAIYEFPIRTSPDPSITDLFACDAIPTESNGETGLNLSHWCDPEADRLMKASDGEQAPLLRAGLLNEVYALEAEDFIGLPLYVVPVVSAWQYQIAGPIADFSSSVYGLFFNMNDWYVAPV